MKKKLLALTSILFITTTVFNAFNANAQLVTISETHQLPAYGDTIHYVDANSFGFDPTGTGPVTAKIWDNSALLNAGTTYDFFYVDPGSIAGNGIDSFPFANMARGESGATGYFYYQNTINNINRIGWFGSTSNYGIYEDMTVATEFHFPITAGQTVTSAYHGRYAPFNLGEDSVTIESGTVTINADMQGTMILPTGAFTDVLRLHVLENFRIKVYLIGVPLIDYLVSDDYYYWFEDTILQPIIISGVTTVDGTPQTPVLRYQPIPGSTTGIADNNIVTPNISPNPSNGKFTIKNYDAGFANYNLEIYNAVGEKIHFTESKQQTSVEIDITGSPKGIYFLKIYSAQKMRMEKIVIQ
ncbi:MAG TPA: T9SS type A sorting domain-containing protein [Bacteroidia bacterium]|nr:T9SS type A sorting domain-containing protein [Bacteroidia bacterium]